MSTRTTVATLFAGAGLLAILSTGVDAQAPPTGAVKESRDALIARSKVWMPTDIPSMNLLTGPSEPDALPPRASIDCTYLDKELSGRSPKFACKTPAGEELKVKFGGNNGEVYAEVAATRLLWALGFGADRMYTVKVTCKGCPEDLRGILKPDGSQIFDPAIIEHKLAGREPLKDSGWAWKDLALVNPGAGGATRAERDALTLLAVMLQHSDSKSQQQRLLCLDEAEEGTSCTRPFMMINDVGIMFGRANTFNDNSRGSMNLSEWAMVPVWKSATHCVGNLPESFTGTLDNPVITEEGRQFLSGLLAQLSDAQIRDMFDAARVHLRARVPQDGRSGFPESHEWVNAFKQKRSEIADRRC